MKQLDLSLTFKNFEGVEMKDGDQPFTLKRFLLTYLTFAHQMGLSTDDQVTLFSAGKKLGSAEGNVQLEQKEYDAIKRMVDNGKVTNGNTQSAVFAIVVSEQGKEMVNAAPTVKE